MPVHAYRVLNSVWNNADSFGAFLPDYAASVAERYGATAASVPSGRITEAVNRWCDEATAGLIPKISDNLSECAAALVNAVYLRSSWLDEFSSRMTEPEDFTGIDGTVTRRDMMKDRGRYRFFEDEETRLISIPLNGGLAFVAVLGDDSDWLADYQAAEFTDVDLWIPKLDTQSDFGREALVQYLMDRGAVDAFNANTADFSRMADYPWYIGDILQKERIRTDEEGLEAAAVTTAMLAYGALRQEEPQYREFHANEPFRYYIVTTQTQTPLVVFAGQEVR
jgi:serpin B